MAEFVLTGKKLKLEDENERSLVLRSHAYLIFGALEGTRQHVASLVDKKIKNIEYIAQLYREFSSILLIDEEELTNHLFFRLRLIKPKFSDEEVAKQKSLETKAGLFNKYTGGTGPVNIQSEIRRFVYLSDEIKRKTFNEEHIGMFIVDCSDVKNIIAAKADSIVKSISTALLQDAEETYQALVADYTDISEALKQIPESEQEVSQLRSFLETCPAKVVELKRMHEATSKRIQSLGEFNIRESYDCMVTYWELLQWPYTVEAMCGACATKCSMVASKLLKIVHKERVALDQTVTDLRHATIKFRKVGGTNDVGLISGEAASLQGLIDNAYEKAVELTQRETDLGEDPNAFAELDNIMKNFSPFFHLWTSLSDALEDLSVWKEGSLWSLEPDNVVRKVNNWIKETLTLLVFFRNERFREPTVVAEYFNSILSEFRIHLPLIRTLLDPAFADRHWVEISTIVGYEINPAISIPFETVLSKDTGQFLKDIARVLSKAKQEMELDIEIKRIERNWDDMAVQIAPCTATKVPGFFVVEDFLTLFEELDHLILCVDVVLMSEFIGPLNNLAEDLQQTLIAAQALLRAWESFQEMWITLFPLFDSDDSRGIIPIESRQFSRLENSWKRAMHEISRDRDLSNIAAQDSLLPMFQSGLEEMEYIFETKRTYFSVKRAQYPRLYLLDDANLLRLLSEKEHLDVANDIIGRIFPGATSIVVETFETTNEMPDGESNLLQEKNRAKHSCRAEICALRGFYGDELKLVNGVQFSLDTFPEWLSILEKEMKASVLSKILDLESSIEHRTLNANLQTNVMQDKILWTHLTKDGILHKNVDSVLRHIADDMRCLLVMLRNKKISGGKAVIQSIHSMIAWKLHARDVTKDLLDTNVTSVDSYDWLKVQRYGIVNDESQSHCDDSSARIEDCDDKRSNVFVRLMSNTTFYGNEYMGTWSHIIIDPMTDRCQRVLVNAFFEKESPLMWDEYVEDSCIYADAMNYEDLIGSFGTSCVQSWKDGLLGSLHVSLKLSVKFSSSLRGEDTCKKRTSEPVQSDDQGESFDALEALFMWSVIWGIGQNISVAGKEIFNDVFRKLAAGKIDGGFSDAGLASAHHNGTVVFIDDLEIRESEYERGSVQEIIRQAIDTQSWFHKGVNANVNIGDCSFHATITVNEHSKLLKEKRLLRHFIPLFCDALGDGDIKAIAAIYLKNGHLSELRLLKIFSSALSELYSNFKNCKLFDQRGAKVFDLHSFCYHAQLFAVSIPKDMLDTPKLLWQLWTHHCSRDFRDAIRLKSGQKIYDKEILKIVGKYSASTSFASIVSDDPYFLYFHDASGKYIQITTDEREKQLKFIQDEFTIPVSLVSTSESLYYNAVRISYALENNKTSPVFLVGEKTKAAVDSVYFAASLREYSLLEPKSFDEIFSLLKKDRNSTEVEDYRVQLIKAERKMSDIMEKINVYESRAYQLTETIEANLGTVIPLLEQSNLELKSISSADVTVLKKLEKPSPHIVLVIEAVCILLGVRPENGTKDSKDALEYVEVAKKKLFHSPQSFLEKIISYDRDSITDEILSVMSLFLEKKNFNSKSVKRQSGVCAILCDWARHLIMFAKISRTINPFQKELREVTAHLEASRLDIHKHSDETDNIKSEGERAAMELEEHLQRLQEFSNARSHQEHFSKTAGRILDAFPSTRQSWLSKRANLEGKLSFSFGDDILSSAFIAYAGPMTEGDRHDFLENILKTLSEANILHSPSFSLLQNMKYCVDSSVYKKIFMLDSYVRDSALITMKSALTVMFIDPLCQGIVVVESILKEPDTVSVWSGAKYFEEIWNEDRKDIPLIIEDIDTPSRLKEILQFLSIDPQKYRVRNKIFLSTRVFDFHVSEDSRDQLNIVRLGSSSSLSKQIQAMVLLTDSTKIKQMKETTERASNVDKHIEDVETKINQIFGSENVSGVYENISTLLDLAHQLKENEALKKVVVGQLSRHAAEEALWKPLLDCAASLSSLLLRLNKIESSYRFSFDHLLMCIDSTIKQVKQQRHTKALVNKLVAFLCKSVFDLVVPSLLDKHRPVFSFLLIRETSLDQEDPLQTDLMNFLFSQTCDNASSGENIKPLVSVVPSFAKLLDVEEAVWSRLSLSKNISMDLDQSSFFIELFEESGQKYVDDEAEDGDGKVMSEENELSLKPNIILAKACILKCVSSDWRQLEWLLNAWIRCTAASSVYIDASKVTIGARIALAKNTTPIFVFQSSVRNSLGEIHQYAEAKNSVRRLKLCSLSRYDSTSMEELIMSHVDRGSWLVVTDCESVDETLQKICGPSLLNVDRSRADQDFRLILMVKPSTRGKWPKFIADKSIFIDCCYRRSLRIRIIHLYSVIPKKVYEPLVEKLGQNFADLSPVARRHFQKLVFCLAYFHTGITNFAETHDKLYEFSDETFKMALDELFAIAKDCGLSDLEQTRFLIRTRILESIYLDKVVELFDDVFVNELFRAIFVQCNWEKDKQIIQDEVLSTFPPTGRLDMNAQPFLEKIPSCNETETRIGSSYLGNEKKSIYFSREFVYALKLFYDPPIHPQNYISVGVTHQIKVMKTEVKSHESDIQLCSRLYINNKREPTVIVLSEFLNPRVPL
eukprot:Stramenopile-MAST_4_protein_3252